MSTPTQYLYRCDISIEGAVDDGGYIDGGRVVVSMRRIRVVRQTPKGVWIGFGKQRFVLNRGKKRFAYPTEEEAQTSFMRRQERRLQILERALGHVRCAIAISPKDYRRDY